MVEGTIIFELYFEIDRLLNVAFSGMIEPLAVGDRVRLEDYICGGEVRFIGMHHELKYEVIGVALDDPFGDHDGYLQGTKYFDCDPQCGVLIKHVDNRGRLQVTPLHVVCC